MDSDSDLLPEPPPLHDPLAALYAALHSPLGLLVRMESGLNLDMARQALYAARKKSGDPRLNVLRIMTTELDGAHFALRRELGPGNSSPKKD